MVETVERLCEIIRIESSIIDDLFAALLQHMTVEDVEKMATVENMKKVAEMIKREGI